MLRTILIPYTNFRKSVACYNDNVLTQTIDLMTRQYRCLSFSRYDVSYRNRDIWCAWSAHPQAYIYLLAMCIDEAIMRRIKYSEKKVDAVLKNKEDGPWKKPLWVGWEPLHSSYRAALLMIGEIERIAMRIILWERLENAEPHVIEDCVNCWFMDNGFSNIYGMYAEDLDIANNALDEDGAPQLQADQFPNHYAQFGWDEEPRGEINIFPPEPGDMLCRV